LWLYLLIIFKYIYIYLNKKKEILNKTLFIKLNNLYYIYII